jgi:hypothetical protein
MPAAYRCEHPECTGKHGSHVPTDERCPVATENMAEYQKIRHGKRKRDQYVYAILLGSSVLKIGCSTQGYDHQVTLTRTQVRPRSLGHFEHAEMIWHHDGNESLEIFLQWCAGRSWDATGETYRRHTEWFYVGGEDKDLIIEKLDNWMRLAEDIDQSESTSMRST